MSKEVKVIENDQLVQVVEKSNMNITKASAYANGYRPFMEQVNELSLALDGMNRANPSDEDSKAARRARLDLVKVRGLADKKKATDKENILIEGRLIDGLYNVIKNTAQLTESEYLEIEKHRERKEEERKSKLKADRYLLLEEFETDLTYIAIGDMSQEQFDSFFDSQKTAFEAKKEAERLAEVARIDAEKKAEEERLAKEKADKEERIRIEKENAKLKEDAEKAAELQAKKDLEAKKEADRLAKIQAEKDKVIAEERAKLEAENNRIAKELADKKAKELEVERIAKEAAEKEAAKLKEIALAPDKEKINAMYLEIKNFNFPELKDPQAKQIIEDVKIGFENILKDIISSAKKLK